jgi:hypothetical protein
MLEQWVLATFILVSGGSVTSISPPMSSMEECFAARELVVAQLGRPIKNYQSVCIVVEDDSEPTD